MPWYRRACERGEARGCKEVSAAEEKVSAEKAEADRIERKRLAVIERFESEKRELRDRLLAQWKEESKEKQAQANSIRSRRHIGYGVAAGGALFGAGAVLFALKGSSNNDEVKAGNFANAKGIQDAIDRGKTYNTLTMVLGGLALAGLGVGIPLAIFNLPSSEPKLPEKPTIPPELVLSPAPGGLLLTLRFP